jgi:hypothetical protein
MAIIHNPDSEYSREMTKWNTQKRHGGFGANGYEPFPAMLYKAFARENGKVMCGDPLAAVGDAAGEAFSRKCQVTVQNEEERDNAVRQGWSLGPDLAIAKYEHDLRVIAEVTAQRHFADQGMGESAQAEAKVADDATHEQVPAVPIKRKAGRPRKVQVQ